MPQACFTLLGILLHVSMPAMQGLSDDQCLVNNLDISTVFYFFKDRSRTQVACTTYLGADFDQPCLSFINPLGFALFLVWYFVCIYVYLYMYYTHTYISIMVISKLYSRYMQKNDSNVIRH